MRSKNNCGGMQMNYRDLMDDDFWLRQEDLEDNPKVIDEWFSDPSLRVEERNSSLRGIKR